jgi:hypothetical protein
MPPRHAFWTILIDNQPTAFRAHDPEELLPTLNRLREKNETAVMKWFERGQLFDSRDEARQAGLGQGERRWEGPRPERTDETDKKPESRGRDKNWRPGGEHRDPRQKYKDAKKAKWTRFKTKIRERHEERSNRDAPAFTPPHGDKLPKRPERDQRPRFDDRRRETRRDFRDDQRNRDERFARGDRPPSRDRTYGDARPSKPHGDPLRNQRPKPQWRDRGETDTRRNFKKPSSPASGRKPWGKKPGGGSRPTPQGFRGSKRPGPPRRRRDDDE